MTIPIELSVSKPIHYNIQIDTLPKLKFDSKVAIISNTTVAPLHLDRVLSQISASQIETIILSDGEEYKNMETIEQILDALFVAKFDRSSTLIALGGGVIGDMTGFAASIYQRGISFVQIPTTLLSQVDASVGGKTGVNTKYGKNLIGAFYQPKAVYIDTAFLSTLPSREFSAGIAEVVKMAVMFDSKFFDYLQKNNLQEQSATQQMIKQSVTLKADVVNKDEKEQGIRAVLNYGHTFAHVIEKQTNYTQYLHGEAVSIGMVMANTLACKLGLLSQNDSDKITNLLLDNNLPVKYTIADIDSFYDDFFLDKKSKNGKLKFILPNGKIGSHVILSEIDENIIKESLSQYEGNDV